MVDTTLTSAIDNMRTIKGEAEGAERAFLKLREETFKFREQVVKTNKDVSKLVDSFENITKGVIKSRQEMHGLENHVNRVSQTLKNMDGNLGRANAGLADNTDETQKVVVESANYTEVLEKMATSLQKMEDRQKKMRIATIKQRKEQEKATKAAKEAAETAHEHQIIIDTLGMTLKSSTHGVYEMNREIKDGTILVNSYGQEVNNLGEVITDFNKRSTLVTKTINKMNKESQSGKFKSFEVFSKEVFAEYKAQGGNIFEFLAEGLSGTREEITLFGIEGAKFRKIVYGFFPPGMFRIINKASSMFQLTGGFIRRMGVGSEEAAKRIEKLRAQKEKMIAEGVPRDDPEIDKLNDAIKKISDAEQGTGSGSIIKSFKKAFKKLQGFDIFGESIQGFKDLAKGPPPQSKVYAGTLGGVQAAPATTALSRGGMIMEQIKLSSKIVFGLGPKLLELSLKQFGLIKKNFKNIIPVVKMAGRFFMSALLYLVLFFMVFTLLKKPILAMFEYLMKFYSVAIVPILEGLKNIFSGFYDIYQAFKGGDIFKLFEGVGKILFGIIQIAVGLVLAWLGTFPALLYGFVIGFKNLIVDQLDKLKNQGAKAAMKSAVFIVAAITAFTIGLPAILTIAALGIIYGIGEAIKNALEGGVKGLLGFKASGGQINTPLTVVGERGPELLVGGRGANVISNQQSRNLIGGGSSVVNYNITVNAKDTSKSEMRRIADEIGKQINQKMNRKRGANVV